MPTGVKTGWGAGIKSVGRHAFSKDLDGRTALAGVVSWNAPGSTPIATYKAKMTRAEGGVID